MTKYRLVPPTTFVAYASFKVKAGQEVEANPNDPRVHVLLERGHIEEVKESPKKPKRPRKEKEL